MLPYPVTASHLRIIVVLIIDNFKTCNFKILTDCYCSPDVADVFE